MTRSPEREEPDQGFGGSREVDPHCVPGIVIARRDIEYVALSGMIATIPGLSCLGWMRPIDCGADGSWWSSWTPRSIGCGTKSYDGTAGVRCW